MKTLEIKPGFVALVDDSDFDLLTARNWYISSRQNRHYLKSGGLYFHHLVLPNSSSLDVDHINGNCLDNRRENLRLVTRSQNCANKVKSKSNTSGYKGVHFCIQTGKWRAIIMVKGKSKGLGRFATKEEAAQRYNQAACAYYGEHAKLNTINEQNITTTI